MCLTTTFDPIFGTDGISLEFIINTFREYFDAAKTAINENYTWGDGGNLTFGYLVLHSFQNARRYAVAVKGDISNAKNNIKKVLVNPEFSHIAHLFCDLEDLSKEKAIALLRRQSEFKDWYN